jgi:hypothetical protein
MVIIHFAMADLEDSA